MICEANCHLYLLEQGGYAQINGVAVRPVAGEHGLLHPEQVEGLVRPENIHFPRTRLLCLENTHNRGGGRIQPFETLLALCRWGPRARTANAPGWGASSQRGRGHRDRGR